MPADTANTTLASAPYFDDFDESKKFHRVLFRPSFPVQARELTQLQSILQNQIERFGDSVYKTGSVIKGCAPTVISDANYIVVPDTFDVSNTSYENAIAYGATSGVQARILKGISGFTSSTNPPKFIIKYTTVGANGVSEFVAGESISIYDAGQSYVGNYKFTVVSATGFSVDDRIRGKTSDAKGTISAINGNVLSVSDIRGDFIQGETIELTTNIAVNTTANTITVDFTTAANPSGTPLSTTAVVNNAVANNNYTPTGNAYAISVSEGVVYQKGFFIKTEPQIVVLNASSGGPAAANGILVGIETAESVITEFADPSLYDNSGNISNEGAPGAHRLKLDTTFVKYAKGSEPEEEIFFAIGEFGSNNILRWNTTSLSGRVSDELAQRTYDESGHYTVKDFRVTTRPADQPELFEYVIGSGKAYVRGNPIKFDTEQYLTSRRGTDTESPVKQIVSMNYGNFVDVQEVRGFFAVDESVTVNLYDEFQNAISESVLPSDAPSGNIIGTANIRNIVYNESGDPKGSPNAEYKFYLFNIKMNSNKSFSDVRSIVYEESGKNAFADISVSSVFSTVITASIDPSNVGGGYVTGDTVVVSGGEGEFATLLISANTSGNVTSLGVVSGGRYTILPTANTSTPVDVTGGNGTGLKVILTYDGEVKPELQDSSYSPLVFGLTNRAVKSLKDAEDNADTRFYYNISLDASLANTGSISVSIPDGGSFFGFSDGADASEAKIDIVLLGTETAIETISLDGTITSNNRTVTGSSTYFERDFVVGEKIKEAGGNTAIITAIIDNDTLIVDQSLGTIGSATAYSRVHDKGSTISLSTSNRTISVSPNMQSLSVDLGPNFTFTSPQAIKVRAYARKVNARPIEKTVKRNQLVRFYNGSLDGTISSSTTTITGSGTALSTFFKEGTYVRANGQTRKVVSVANATSMTIDSAFIPDVSANTFEVVHPYGFNMGVPDVFKINSISITAGTTDVGGKDIKQYFTYDFGQRDTHYDHAVLYPKSTASISNSYLLVDFDCFEANASIGKGFFSVESYEIDDSLGANTQASIRTWEIPTFYSQARQRDFDLRDSIDFRPYRLATATLTANAQATTLNPATTTDFNTATTEYNPFPGQNFECNLTYYLPRIDSLVLTSKGEFRVIEGDPSLQPRTKSFSESDAETQMIIATTYIPPYPSLTTLESQTIKIQPYMMKVSPSINKRFTMKDISAIEQRVSSLEYYTTLTRLEQKATQLNIPNADGIDRFKNGIFVDPFDNHNLARLNDPEHQIVIDTLNGIGRPKVSVETIKLELDTDFAKSVEVIRDSGANHIAYNRNFVTVDYDANTLFLEQAFATREIPIDSDDRFLFGTVDLDKEIFSDVEQFRTYPNREYGAAYDSYETNTNYTVELIYPNSRTVKILARGLKPNALHYIGVDGVDYSAKAIQGYIQFGQDELAENIVADGPEGAALYADSNGRLYAIVNLPGNLSLGSHTVVVADVVASAVSNGFCSSRAFGSFVINSIDDISDYPPEPQPPLPKTGLIVADFDFVGTQAVIEGTPHTFDFIDRTNRGVVAPEGSVLETPVEWEWTFVHCSTGCVDSDVAISTDPNPTDVTFTYPSMIETVYVKLKVRGSGGTYSEVIKPIQLVKYADNTNGLKLLIENQLPGSDNDYNLPGSVTLKATNYLHLIFTAYMAENRVSGGRCKIAITGNKSSGSQTKGDYFTATNIGTAELTNYTDVDVGGIAGAIALSNGGAQAGLRWRDSNVQPTTITVVVTYENSSGDILDTLTKTISWTNTGTIAPCKPCEQFEVTPIDRLDPCTAKAMEYNASGLWRYQIC